MSADYALSQHWHRDRFGIHDHPEEWPLNMTARAHDYCVKVWACDHRDDWGESLGGWVPDRCGMQAYRCTHCRTLLQPPATVDASGRSDVGNDHG